MFILLSCPPFISLRRMDPLREQLLFAFNQASINGTKFYFKDTGYPDNEDISFNDTSDIRTKIRQSYYAEPIKEISLYKQALLHHVTSDIFNTVNVCNEKFIGEIEKTVNRINNRNMSAHTKILEIAACMNTVNVLQKVLNEKISVLNFVLRAEHFAFADVFDEQQDDTDEDYGYLDEPYEKIKCFFESAIDFKNNGYKPIKLDEDTEFEFMNKTFKIPDLNFCKPDVDDLTLKLTRDLYRDYEKELGYS